MGKLKIIAFVVFTLYAESVYAQPVTQPRPPQLPTPQSGWEGRDRFNQELKEYRQQMDMVHQINRNTQRLREDHLYDTDESYW